MYLAPFSQEKKKMLWDSTNCKSYAMLFKDLNSHTNLVQEVEELTYFDILYNLIFKGVTRGQNCPISFMEPGLRIQMVACIPSV